MILEAIVTLGLLAAADALTGAQWNTISCPKTDDGAPCSYKNAGAGKPI